MKVKEIGNGLITVGFVGLFILLVISVIFAGFQQLGMYSEMLESIEEPFLTTTISIIVVMFSGIIISKVL